MSTPIMGAESEGPFRYGDGFLVIQVNMGNLQLMAFYTGKGQADYHANQIGEGGQDAYVIPVSRAIRQQAADS